MKKTENKIDKLKNRFKDHPIGFIVTVVFLIVISLGLFTDSLDKAIEFGKKYLFPPEKKISTTTLRGVVRDINSEPVSGAVVEVLELPGKSITTTNDGGFYFPEVPGKAGDRVRVYISKPGYQKHNEYVTLPGPIIIKLEK